MKNALHYSFAKNVLGPHAERTAAEGGVNRPCFWNVKVYFKNGCSYLFLHCTKFTVSRIDEKFMADDDVICIEATEYKDV